MTNSNGTRIVKETMTNSQGARIVKKRQKQTVMEQE